MDYIIILNVTYNNEAKDVFIHANKIRLSWQL